MKKITALLLTGALLLLVGCAGKADQPAADLDLNAIAETLLQSGLFEETLYQTEEGIAQQIYSITDASDALLYVGSGAAADELALFAFEDDEAARVAVDAASERVADQKESFSDYIPEEVPKLNNAVVERFGRYIVVCVSGRDDAKERIAELFEPES